MLTEAELTDLVNEQLPAWRKERERLDRLDRWYRWRQEDLTLPRRTTPELRELAALSQVPWLGLVVTSCAQCMYVDGYRSVLDPVDAPADAVPMAPSGPWRIWQANGMDQRQISIHRYALAYGYCYATALPGQDFLGESMPVIRGVSPRKMWAVYADPAEDDWPVYAMRVSGPPDDSTRQVKFYDDQAVYTLTVRSGSSQLSQGQKPVTLNKVEVHNAGRCPVVRYCNELDLDGRTPGEVEPHISLAKRINKTAYDRMLTQHFNSWKVRTVAGMAEPDTEEEAIRKRVRLNHDTLLVAEDPDTKFGTLAETGMDGFIRAWEADIHALAAVTQTPTHELTGQMANLSAEALAAARASLTQKVAERQKSFGKSHAQLLRLGAALDGDLDHARDVTGRVTWQDMEIRSMAQAVDALGKAATMLQVPVQALWGRIPGVERSDVEEWQTMARESDPVQAMHDQLSRQVQPLPSSDSPQRVSGSDQLLVGQR